VVTLTSRAIRLEHLPVEGAECDWLPVRECIVRKVKTPKVCDVSAIYPVHGTRLERPELRRLIAGDLVPFPAIPQTHIVPKIVLHCHGRDAPDRAHQPERRNRGQEGANQEGLSPSPRVTGLPHLPASPGRFRRRRWSWVGLGPRRWDSHRKHSPCDRRDSCRRDGESSERSYPVGRDTDPEKRSPSGGEARRGHDPARCRARP